MINGPTSSPAGSAVFPDPPKGSPGEIAGCARTLANGGDDLDHVEGGLRNAGSSLESDWKGYAAGAYHASSSALAAVARAGSTEFRECARAVSGYGQALDHAQSGVRRLRASYDDAKRRQATASGLTGRLGTSLAAAHKPDEITRLSNQITRAQGNADQAGIDADGFAHRAQGIIDDFKQQAARYQAILEGQQPGQPPLSLGGPFEAGPSPFSPFGSPGPGFGVPFTGPGLNGANGLQPGGLDQYNGVLPTGPDPYKSPIPGFPTYWDSRHENLTSPGDLTNLILALSGAGALRDLGSAGLRELARELGIGALGREAVTEAEDKAALESLRGLKRFEKVLEKDGKVVRNPDGAPKTILQAGKKTLTRQAGITVKLGQREARIELGSHVVNALQAVHYLPGLPGEVRELITHLVVNRYGYMAATGTQLVRLQSALIANGSPPALRAAGAVGDILKAISR